MRASLIPSPPQGDAPVPWGVLCRAVGHASQPATARGVSPARQVGRCARLVRMHAYLHKAGGPLGVLRAFCVLCAGGWHVGCGIWCRNCCVSSLCVLLATYVCKYVRTYSGEGQDTFWNLARACTQAEPRVVLRGVYSTPPLRDLWPVSCWNSYVRTFVRACVCVCLQALVGQLLRQHSLSMPLHLPSSAAPSCHRSVIHLQWLCGTAALQLTRASLSACRCQLGAASLLLPVPL